MVAGTRQHRNHRNLLSPAAHKFWRQPVHRFGTKRSGCNLGSRSWHHSWHSRDGLCSRRSGASARHEIYVCPAVHTPSREKLVQLSLWTLGYVAANQIALVVIKNLASPGSGGVDAYSKAFVLLQLPHGLLAVSIATTFVPDLARMFHRGDHQQFSQSMASGIRLTALLTIPASCALWVMSKPIIGLLFQHGNFSAAATENTARALSGLAIGLAGFSIYLFVLRGFYARNDTRTPFFINVGENAINIVLAIVLVDRHGVFGLGLAFSIAYLVSALVALLVLESSKLISNCPNWRSTLCGFR